MVARQPMLVGGKAVLLPSIPRTRGQQLKRMLYVLRGDVERLGATDGRVPCSSWATQLRSLIRQRARDECKSCWRKNEVGRVRLEMRRLRQPSEVAKQQPGGASLSHDSKERAGK